MGFSPMTEEERDVYSEIAKKLCGPEFNPGILFPLQIAMTLDQAKVYLEMPGSVEEISKKTDASTEFVAETFEELYHKGYAVLTRKSGYQLARSVIQVVDTGPTQAYAEKLGDEYFKALYGSMGEVPTLALASMPIALLKVILHPQALEKSGFTGEDILPIEDDSI